VVIDREIAINLIGLNVVSKLLSNVLILIVLSFLFLCFLVFLLFLSFLVRSLLLVIF
jgi:hypothetical protein